MQRILTAILILLVGLFSFSLFKNIQYPLLWQDEADTAMFGKRILEFGYPKAHDGKNYINPYDLRGGTLAINKRYDAYLYSGWIQFYFAAPWVFWARSFSDLYQKTAVLRIPFAISGLLSLVILSFGILPVFKNRIEKLLFLIFFMILEIFSISTILHMREVRYYSLTMLFTYIFLYVYLKYKIFHQLNYRIYFALFLTLSVILFNTYSPIYFIFFITLFLFETIQLLRKLKSVAKKSGLTKYIFQNVLAILQPYISLFISLVLIFPFLKFFDFLNLAKEYAKSFNLDPNRYFLNLQRILIYFQRFEFTLTFSLSAVFIILLLSNKHIRKKICSGKKFSISYLLFIFFVVYILFIPNSPLMFTRYFIVLLPIMVVLILLNISIILENIKTKNLFLIALMTVLLIDGANKIGPLKGHIYEMFHQYRGPLDYTIPYIKENIKNPENLVIATNYEDTSYMYYLDSKVIIGYLANNLKEDMNYTPDIVSYRKIPWWGKAEIFLKLMENKKYDMVDFPVADYLYNNIPDLYFNLPHRFKTLLTDNEKAQVVLFIKTGLLPTFGN